MDFVFSRHTQIIYTGSSPAVLRAISMLRRDMEKTLSVTENTVNRILLQTNQAFPQEHYEIHIENDQKIILEAGDELGFVYGLLFISETWLGILPFWFFLDQQIPLLDHVTIPSGHISSPPAFVRFRGWFLNDEVLFLHWKHGHQESFPWDMAFEALLRCHGNMVIPGTDKTSRRFADLAASYGLWITHHHAEPLGAEIFARAYPDKLPSYSKNPDCFLKLWEEAILRQKDKKVIWTLGFRGQGDCPFWESKGEEEFDTPKKRGELISQLIEQQRLMVCRHVKNPIFCTNLYGEVMELYAQGYITLHPGIIKIWADNGYGKMCTRRQDNHCTRVPSLPSLQDPGPHGVYYHASFHDLQAAGHITALPNTIDFVNRELSHAYSCGVRDYWLINASNVRPHAYYLDAIQKLWNGRPVSDASHSREFADAYYDHNPAVADCLKNYAHSLLSYGKEEDQHAGEQFYNYCVRLLARQFIIDRTQSCCGLLWLTGQIPFWDQVEKVLSIHQNGIGAISFYHKKCQETSRSLFDNVKTLFDGTVLLQSQIHFHCCQGAILFCQGLLQFQKSAYQRSFYLLGSAAEEFTTANSRMRQAEYGIWKSFYENDCLTDILFTAYMIHTAMRIIRVIGDDQRLADWYEDLVRPAKDRKVRLLAITDHHMTDQALYEVMKDKNLFSNLTQ